MSPVRHRTGGRRHRGGWDTQRRRRFAPGVRAVVSDPNSDVFSSLPADVLLTGGNYAAVTLTGGAVGAVRMPDTYPNAD